MMTTIESLKLLNSTVCFCGRAKGVRRAFCYGDYMKLPKIMKSELYFNVGAGFEEAYDAAVDWLTDQKERAAIQAEHMEVMS